MQRRIDVGRSKTVKSALEMDFDPSKHRTPSSAWQSILLDYIRHPLSYERSLRNAPEFEALRRKADEEARLTPLWVADLRTSAGMVGVGGLVLGAAGYTTARIGIAYASSETATSGITIALAGVGVVITAIIVLVSTHAYMWLGKSSDKKETNTG